MFIWFGKHWRKWKSKKRNRWMQRIIYLKINAHICLKCQYSDMIIENYITGGFAFGLVSIITSQWL